MYAENLISTPEAQADFYPTPKELGKKMLQGIDLGFISTVLEPSAGKGGFDSVPCRRIDCTGTPLQSPHHECGCH